MRMDVIKGKDAGTGFDKESANCLRFGGSGLEGERKCMESVGTRVRGWEADKGHVGRLNLIHIKDNK